MGLEKFCNINYQLTSSDNFGAYLDALGVDANVRDAILGSTSSMTLTKNGEAYTVHTKSSLRDHETTFTPGEEFTFTGIDGRTFNMVVNIEGNKTTAEMLGNPRAFITTEFSTDKIVVHHKTGNVEATQTYEKV